MKIFSNNEIGEIFRRTVEEEHVSMIELVNRVGEAVANEINSRFDPKVRIVVFAGWGNNGAFALSAARKLLTLGYDPEIYLFNIGGDRLVAECANAKKFLTKDFPKCKFYEVTQSFNPPILDSQCVAIDGLFGPDLNRVIPKSFGLVVRSISESGAYIVSIEIPSGLFSEWNTANTVSSDIMHADLTLAIEFPFLSFFMPENIPLVGEWKVLDIGLSQKAIRETPYKYYLVQKHDMQPLLKPRAKGSSKADYGSALICGGSYGMMGAAVLAAKGCLRAGAGKVTCYGPRCGFNVLQTAVPCAMFISDSHELDISKIIPNRNYSAMAVGPGIGTSDSTISAVENFLKMCQSKRQSLVIDADALNCIAHKPMMLNYLPVLSVLTPHAGEFDRIFGSMPSTEARIRKALEVAEYHNIIIVLKGHYTAIVLPDGAVYFNSSGTPALATPGSGDVLTGVITALMAQGYVAERASMLGVYIHGVAGEMAEREHGQYGVTAADVADNIGRAIKSIMEE